MPNFLTHLAVAKRYADKNNLKGDDARAFFYGNVYPDLGADADKSDRHYYFATRKRTSVGELTREEFGKNRIDFKKFFTCQKIKTPFEKGVLLHLIVDSKCYPAVLDMNRFYDISKKGVRPRWVVTTTFNSINDYLKQKYNIDFDMTGVKDVIQSLLAEWEKENGEIPYVNLLDSPESIKRLDDFIENISDINLDEFVVSIKQQPQ